MFFVGWWLRGHWRQAEGYRHWNEGGEVEVADCPSSIIWQVAFGPMRFKCHIMDFKHIINNKVIWRTSKTIPCPIKILWNEYKCVGAFPFCYYFGWYHFLQHVCWFVCIRVCTSVCLGPSVLPNSSGSLPDNWYDPDMSIMGGLHFARVKCRHFDFPSGFPYLLTSRQFSSSLQHIWAVAACWWTCCSVFNYNY